jgi:hypothetical protein
MRGSEALIRVAVIDGQGAGIGSAIIRKIRQTCGNEIEIWALGANDIATSQMMKAGANRGATGEGPVCECVHQVDVILGSLSILISHAMMGEITPAMAVAVGASRAVKILLPIVSEPVAVVGAIGAPLPQLVERLVSEHLVAIVKDKRRSLPD